MEIFSGVATALITPFDKNLNIDYTSFREIIDWQIEEGIDGIVVAGTTGEAPTLTDSEHIDLVKVAVDVAHKRVPIIAGTGSNCTSHAVDMTKTAYEVGADGVLCVTPYYNKATEEGLIENYKCIARASALPVIMYNVPSRTGVDISLKVYEAVASEPNIVAVKEASGDINKTADIINALGDSLTVYSGNDDIILPMLSLGAKGVISVLSNVLPRETKDICVRWESGDIEGAREVFYKYRRLTKSLFSEVNPVPIKSAMSIIGKCGDYLRLPLTTLKGERRARLEEIMRGVLCK